jgi:hypothetical protein
MKKLIALVLLAACGAPADEVWQLPEDDRLAMFPDILFRGPDGELWARVDGHDIGSAEQAFTAAEYHGQQSENDRGCYANAGGNCTFPSRKDFRVQVTTNNCFDDPSISTLQESFILDTFRDAILSMHNMATGVKVAVNSNLTNGIRLKIQCNPPSGCGSSTATGCGGADGVSSSHANLPVGPHGNDEGSAMLHGAVMAAIQPPAIKAVAAACGYQDTNTNLARVTKYTAIHEALHAMGFGHTQGTNTIMYGGGSGCSRMFSSTNDTPMNLVPFEYKQAMAIYNPYSSGVSIQDVNLETHLP